MVQILLSENYEPISVEIESATSVRDVLDRISLSEESPLFDRLESIKNAVSNGHSSLTVFVDGYPTSVGSLGTVKPESNITFQGKNENGLR